MAFFTLLLYITCIYLRPAEWILAMYGWQIIDWLAIITAFFIILESAKSKKIILMTPQNFLLLGFLGTIVLSHLSHAYFWGAYDSFIKFSKTVIMFFLFVNVLDSGKKLKVSLWFIVFLTVILAIQGIDQFKNGFGWAGQPLSKTGRINWIGIFNDANDLALALVMAIGFILAFIFGRVKMISKIISISLLGILLYALYLTNSRGGYLALGATVFFYFLRKFRKKIFAAIIGGIAILLIFAHGPSRLSMISASEESAFGRIEAWYEGIQMLKSSPLFGIGYGMFTDEFRRTAHNSFVLVAAEEGLIGLFFWVALIYVCFKGLSTLKKRNPQLINYTSGLEASLFGFMSSAFFLSRSYQAILYIILALTCSFIYVFLKKEDYTFNYKDMRIAGLLSLGILLVAWITMRVSLRMVG